MNQVAHQVKAYPGFRSMKRLLPPGRNASPTQCCICTPGWRGYFESKVSSSITRHNVPGANRENGLCQQRIARQCYHFLGNELNSVPPRVQQILFPLKPLKLPRTQSVKQNSIFKESKLNAYSTHLSTNCRRNELPRSFQVKVMADNVASPRKLVYIATN